MQPHVSLSVAVHFQSLKHPPCCPVLSLTDCCPVLALSYFMLLILCFVERRQPSYSNIGHFAVPFAPSLFVWTTVKQGYYAAPTAII